MTYKNVTCSKINKIVLNAAQFFFYLILFVGKILANYLIKMFSFDKRFKDFIEEGCS